MALCGVCNQPFWQKVTSSLAVEETVHVDHGYFFVIDLFPSFVDQFPSFVDHVLPSVDQFPSSVDHLPSSVDQFLSSVDYLLSSADHFLSFVAQSQTWADSSAY